MGMFLTRQNPRVEEVDLGHHNAYKYPPKSGNYFGSHFIMGGERFEVTQPEAYLFGENTDLNFLGSKPTPFPYPAPQPNEPTRTLKSLINIRKESLRFVKTVDTNESGDAEEGKPNTVYNIEFTVDSDVRCAITIYHFCVEEITTQGVVYTPRDPSMNSETYHYKKGANQQFSQMSHTFDPSKFPEESLVYHYDEEVLPVVIQCVAEAGDPPQSHSLVAVIEKNGDSTYTLKPLKQKLFVDGLCYLLQEIYGIENKNLNSQKDMNDEDIEENGSECVICMSDARDTLILPCRHLCLCNNCADSLRYQANNCPICRAPFRALLQIRAVQKSSTVMLPSGENQASNEVPPGYESVPLIEALNGPPLPSAPPVSCIHPSIPILPESPHVLSKRNLESKKKSGSSSPVRGNSVKSEECNNEKIQEERAPTPEVVVVSNISSPEKNHHKPQTTFTDGRKHRKGSHHLHSAIAHEKVRLLSESAHGVTGNVTPSRRHSEKESEAAAETRSLLETTSVEKVPLTTISCRGQNPIYVSTPHSLHLCEKEANLLSPDISPGGDESDYYTPEDPNMTMLVDQGTDTNLDIMQEQEDDEDDDETTEQSSPQVTLKEMEKTTNNEWDEIYVLWSPNHIPESENCSVDKTEESEKSDTSKHHGSERNNSLEDEGISEIESIQEEFTPSKRPLISSVDPSSPLPGTPASNASNRSSGESYSSASSTKLLLPQFNILPE